VFDGNVTLYSQWDIPMYGGVTCITGDLRVERSSLTGLTGLETLVAVGGVVQIRSNSALVSVDGLGNLKSAGGIAVESNERLSSLAGLANLQTLGSDPVISYNQFLPACWAQTIAQQTSWTCANCWGNDGTSPCHNGPPPAGSVYGPIWLTSQADIQRLSGVERVMGELIVSWDATLTDLVGLESLTRIEGPLTVYNTSLASLHGLDNLSAVTGSVLLYGNSALTSLDGLSALASAGDFRVIYNPALTEAAMPALTSVATWTMAENHRLPPCWPLLLEQRFGLGCANCASSNTGTGACPAPVDGWIDQEPNGAGYVITFASGGGAGPYATIAEAHAAHPSLVLAEPVYDGFITENAPNWYFVNLYSGGGACCWTSVEEARSDYSQLLLRAP
jgi:hypothetical protein